MKKFVTLSATLLTLSLSSILAETQSTISDQTDVSVTAYNNNIALVRDRRKLELVDGVQELTFMDVAQQIRPETVSMRSLTEPGSIQVLEQNYEFDLISPDKILEKYLGKDVKLRNFSKDSTFHEVAAKLISLNGGAIYKVGDEIHLNHPGSVVLPEIPENLIAKPSLVWLLDNKQPQQDLVVTYITGGIYWKADYIAYLNRNDSELDIIGHVTLTNQSGTSYNNALLKLVAGDVHQAQAGGHHKMNHQFAARAMMAGESMQEESFGDYHLYKLPRRTTIKDNQTKQVHLLSGHQIQTQKVYEYRGQPCYYPHAGTMQNQKVGVFLKFKNTLENHLGLPLPAGTMRVYQEDSESMAQLVGEDSITHTPKDEEVTIKLGNAFDIVAERTQKEFTSLPHNGSKSTHEIVIRNHKETDVTVNVLEQIGGNATIKNATIVTVNVLEHIGANTKNSCDFNQVDAFNVSFPVTVPHNGKTVLTYTVEVRP